MADEQQQQRKGGFGSTVAKKALAPVVASAATAGTAFALRKGTEIWQEKILPKLQEKGGGRAVAREALETISGKLGRPASESVSGLAAKVGGDGDKEDASAQPTSDAGREQERQKRAQRREQRRRAVDQAGSS